MDSHTFWNKLTMYNDNVMKWCGSIYDEDVEFITYEQEEDIIVYDDSDEWYNIYGDEE